MTLHGRILRTLTLTLGVALAAQPIAAAADDGFTLATGRVTGKSFAVGVGISSLAKVKLLPEHKMDLSPVETEGFVDNVRMLQRNEAQFAILQAMFGHFARTGTGTFAGEAPNDDIRAIAMLWRDAEHFVMDDSDVETGTIADIERLRNQPVSLGVDGPGPIESNRLLLSHFNVDIDQTFDLHMLNYQQSSDALQRGEIKAMSTPIRPPAPHVEQALTDGRHHYRLLEFTDEQIERADGGLGLWTRYIIPAATYPGQTQDIQTVAKSNLLVARKDVDPEVVYQVTKAVFENLDFLRNIHDAMYETSLDRALVGVPMPLHPGALRYYQEIGLLGPDANLEVALADKVRGADSAAFKPNGGFKASLVKTAAIPGDAAAPTLAAPSPITPAAAPKTFTVYFDLNERDVNGQGMQELAEISAYADNLTSADITVAGHTDHSGDPAYNRYLAEQRARSVVETLTTTFGVAGHDIRVMNLGDSEPAIDDGREFQPQNRRVEITVVPAGSEQADEQAGEQAEAPQPQKSDKPSWMKRASI